MWTVEGQDTDWPKLDSLEPECVLDFYDEPRLFTVRTDEHVQLLAYFCDRDSDIDRFILVPTGDDLVIEIKQNLITLRDALRSQPLAWLIDRNLEGSLSRPRLVDLRKLPENVLPREGARLSADSEVLLRLRMVGDGVEAGNILASVVKRAVDGATDAIKILVRYASGASEATGRPSDVLRRLYDLPARHFSFRSFEIAFGKPSGSQDVFDDNVWNQIRLLLEKGLSWADDGAGDVSDTPEWTAIVSALAKLAPPQTGPVQEVEVSGVLAGLEYRSVRLTRDTSRRISDARKLLNPDVRLHTDVGFIRELDKDKLTFTLRNAQADNLRLVEFSEDRYDDVILAFDTDRVVTILSSVVTGRPAELVSISFGTSTAEEDGSGGAVSG